MRYWQKFAAASALGGALALTGLGEDNGQAQALQAPTQQTFNHLNSCINQTLSSGQATREANSLVGRVPEAGRIRALRVRDGNNWLDKQVAYNICARANGVEESPLYFSTDDTAQGGLTPDGRPLVVQREVQTVPVPVPVQVPTGGYYGGAPGMDAYNYQYQQYQLWQNFNYWGGGGYAGNWSRPIPHWMQGGGGGWRMQPNFNRPYYISPRIPHWAQGSGGMWGGGGWRMRPNFNRPYFISPRIPHLRR